MAKLTPNSINTTLVQDGQAAGSITPSDMRTIVSSLAGLPSTTIANAAYTLVLTDDGTRIRMDSVTTARILTVPPHSSVAFDVDTLIVVFAANTGIITITPGAGVTFHSTLTLTSGSLVMAQYQTVVLQQDLQDLWVLG